MRASPSPASPSGAEDRSIRRTWWLLSGAFIVLGASVAARLWLSGDPLDWIPAVAVVVTALAAVAHRNAVAALEARGRGEAESFARILHGLSRSVSADAIVAAILGDLADATAADHAVAIRRRPDGIALEATLVTRRPGVPSTTTVLPVADLDGPPAQAAAPGAGSGGEHGTPMVRAHAVPLARAEPALLGPPDGAPDLPPRPATRGAWTEFVGLLRDLGLPIRAPRTSAGDGPLLEILGSPLDAAAVTRASHRVRALYGLANTLAAPLRTEQGLAGVIVVSRRTPDPWPPSARRLTLAAAAEATAALARAHSFREAAVGASTDALTGLPNRRYFEEFCTLLARRRRAGDGVAVLMIDIDKFKSLNDTYGHPVGDVVLRAVGGAIVRTVRDDDVPARVGGEEFAVLLRNPGSGVAAEVGERVRVAVRTLDLDAVGVPRVTVSVGVATARADEPIPEVIDRADQALLRAKRGGRDRVIAG